HNKDAHECVSCIKKGIPCIYRENVKKRGPKAMETTISTTLPSTNLISSNNLIALTTKPTALTSTKLTEPALPKCNCNCKPTSIPITNDLLFEDSLSISPTLTYQQSILNSPSSTYQSPVNSPSSTYQSIPNSPSSVTEIDTFLDSHQKHHFDPCSTLDFTDSPASYNNNPFFFPSRYQNKESFLKQDSSIYVNESKILSNSPHYQHHKNSSLVYNNSKPGVFNEFAIEQYLLDI
ncbi:hypothetical protein HK099_003362, partial [Clydaea vesicula]